MTIHRDDPKRAAATQAALQRLREPTAACPTCRGEFWVCETHRDKPWWRDRGCDDCGGAGAPCPTCNQATPPRKPRLPIDFIPYEYRPRRTSDFSAYCAVCRQGFDVREAHEVSFHRSHAKR